MRSRSLAVALAGLVLTGACRRADDTGGSLTDRVRRDLGVLSHDSMAGRRTGTPGAAAAAAYVAAQLEAAGVEPAGDSGFFQVVPFIRTVERGIRLARSWAEYDSLAARVGFTDLNVVGLIRGTDPGLGGQAVIVGAHHDHVGTGRPVQGDSIYNGADDDASGVAAVLEIARAFADSGPPARTVVFLVTTGEEQGLLGTEWYADHPAVPLDRTVADLQIEMIGRPDTAVGGVGRAWLTGFDQSTMGETLAAAGLAIEADPRVEQDFFRRSDNYVFARRGVPAHTLSSFTMHADYHGPGDEIERIDFPHLSAVIETAIEAARILADGPAPQWRPGMQPGG